MWRHVEGRRVCEIGRLDFKTDLCVWGMVSPPHPPPHTRNPTCCGVPSPGATVGHADLLQKESLGWGLRGGAGVDRWSRTGDCSPEAAANPWLDDEPRDRDQGMIC